MPPVNQIEKLCQRARQAIEGRDWNKAKLSYLQALGLKSDLPDVHYGLATVYFQLRELTSAAHHFREVTRLDPLRAGAYINLGAVLNLLNQYDEAVATLRRGIQLDTSRVEGYYNLGVVYKRKGQPDLAIQAYKEAIRINPRMVDAQLNLANLYLEKEQYRQAILFYEQALQNRPNWAKALEGLAQAKAAMGEGDKGAEVVQAIPAAAAGKGKGKGAPAKDPERLVDPNAHGALLGHLHQAAQECETFGGQLEQHLEQHMEPIIKELSTCLLYAEGGHGDLNEITERYENSLKVMLQIKKSLQESLAHVREHGEKVQDW